MTRGELLTELAAMLDARHEARFILDEVLGATGATGRTALDQPLDQPLDDAAVATARRLATRRCGGEPLQYILGHWAFRALDLIVDPRVLIPRPETELVVDVALTELDRLEVADPVVVDAGTGSGALALALATERTAARVWALDASPDALAVAAANLARVGEQHAGLDARVTLVKGDWLGALPDSLRGAVNLVVANPPYVAESEWAALPDDVKLEPRQALVAPDGSDHTPGLADVETLLHQALAWLSRPGAIVIELAPHQADAAAVMARHVGYFDVRVAPDLAQRPRALVGRLR